MDRKFFEDAIPSYNLPEQLLWLQTKDAISETILPEGWKKEDLCLCQHPDGDRHPSEMADGSDTYNKSLLDKKGLEKFCEQYSCDLEEMKRKTLPQSAFNQAAIEQITAAVTNIR